MELNKMSKPKKIGKDAIGGKGSAIIQTVKDREDYAEYKRRKAEEQEEEEKQKKKVGSEKMIDEKEPRPEGLTLEEFAQMKALARLKQKKRKVKIEVE